MRLVARRLLTGREKDRGGEGLEVEVPGVRIKEARRVLAADEQERSTTDAELAGAAMRGGYASANFE